MNRQVYNDLPQQGRSVIPKFAETAAILLKHLRHRKFLAIAIKILQKRLVGGLFCQKRPCRIHF